MKSLFNLENQARATIVLLPAYLVRFSVFGFPTNLLEILILAFAARTLANRNYRKELFESLAVRWKDFLPVAVLIGALAVSVAVNQQKLANLGMMKGWFVLPLVFAATVSSLPKRISFGKMLAALYLSAFWTATVALAYGLSGKMTYDGRLEAFFNSPNYLAMFLAPAILIAFSEARSIFDSRLALPVKYALILSFFPIAVAFYLTFSYASWAAVLIAAILIESRRGKKSGAIILLILILGVGIFLTQGGTEKMASLIALDERSSLASRLMIWRSASDMLRSDWLFGIGPANFQAEYLAYQKYYPPYLEWAVPHPHNVFLYAWLSSGILGLSAFLLMIIRKLARVINAKDVSGVTYPVIGFLVYFLVIGLFDTYMKNDLAVVFWLILLERDSYKAIR